MAASGERVEFVATSLLKELQRTSKSDGLPPFNRDKFRRVVDEINAYVELIESSLTEHGAAQVKEDATMASGLTTHHQIALRNKRVLLAYLHARAERLQALRWHLGSVLPVERKKNLSESELTFFSDYDKLLGNYMQKIELDLTLNLQQPPKELYVEVRVLEEFGSFVTETGEVNLEKDTIHFLRRADVEPLIRKGIVEHLVSNEK